MTTNDSGKLNMGGVDAIKEITAIPPADWTEPQRRRLDACLTALAHQPTKLYFFQDWGAGGPVKFLADRGIEFFPRPDRHPRRGSYYDGCRCGEPHWRVSKAS